MSNKTAIKMRQSGIELLKIIAMLLIVISHCRSSLKFEGSPFLKYFDIRNPTNDITNFITQIFSYFGVLGNAIFLISSVWFLVDSNNMKLNKIAQMVLDVYVISVIFLLIFFGGGVHPIC